MRLFTAIELDQSVREHLDRYTAECRKMGIRSNYTYIDNYHVTLVFLGEQPEEMLDYAVEAIDAAASRFEPFEMACGRIGSFKSAGRGVTLWAGVEDGAASERVYIELSKQLRARRFKIDGRKYRPHITIARNMMPESIGLLPELDTVKSFADGITLFKSVRGKEHMIYEPQYFAKFNY